MPGVRRRLAAIMFTDMVGYSALAQADEEAALQVLERHNRLLRPVFDRFGGREVKTVGDAFLVEFPSTLDATRCAIEIQRRLREYNSSAPDDWKIRVRIGIHVGDVVERQGDVLGDAVNIASRIEPLAEPDGICLSQQVFDQVHNKIDVPLLRLPPKELKNIRSPLTVYRIDDSGTPAGTPPKEPRSVGEHRLAVLPLSNISPDPHDEYIADGLTEELISVLSHVPGLSVIARTSVMPYKTAPKPIAQIASELGVDAALEGSVRKSGQRLRITLQLIDTGSQRHIWASSYDREMEDVFAVQSDIADRTAEALRLEFSGSPPAKDRDRLSANPEAYDLYLRGLVLANESFSEGMAEAVACFERATQLDPEFAEAFAYWANLYVRASGDYMPLREAMPRARSLAARALELEPNSSSAHATLANIAMQFDLDWPKADAEFQKALQLNRSNIDALQYYGMLLISQQRYDEAREIVRELVRLDPVGLHRGMLAWVEYSAGNLERAVRIAEEPHSSATIRDDDRSGLAGVYLVAGRRADALREARRKLPADAGDSARFDHALMNALLGRPREAREVLRSAQSGAWKWYLSPLYLGMLHAALGENAEALELLERDYREGDRVLWLWYNELYFDGIRDDPRFVRLLHDYHLPIRKPLRLARPDQKGRAGS